MGKGVRYWIQWLPWSLALLAVVLMSLLAVRLGPVGRGVLNLAAILPGQETLAVPAGKFIVIYAATALAGLALFILLPRRISSKAVVTSIFFASVACRAALLPLPPSDDTNRYL